MAAGRSDVVHRRPRALSWRRRGGNQGLELYEAVKPDVVLMDIMPPEKDGIEMARELLRMCGVKHCFTRPPSMERGHLRSPSPLQGRQIGLCESTERLRHGVQQVGPWPFDQAWNGFVGGSLLQSAAPTGLGRRFSPYHGLKPVATRLRPYRGLGGLHT